MKKRSALISVLLAAFTAVVLSAGCAHHCPPDKFGNSTCPHSWLGGFMNR